MDRGEIARLVKEALREYRSSPETQMFLDLARADRNRRRSRHEIRPVCSACRRRYVR